MVRCMKCGRAMRGQYRIWCPVCRTSEYLHDDGKKPKSTYRRKYRQGELIQSLDELYKQEFVYQCNHLVHAGWFKSWQFSFAYQQVKAGRLRYAIKNEITKEGGVSDERVSH